MQEVSAGETKVLLARIGDTCYAIGTNCTHYGAPLVEGSLVGDKIICPWHHACFNARNGNMEEPPALDSLPNFPVSLEGDDIYIDVPENAPDRRPPETPVSRDDADRRTFVIVGGGAAGYMCAQTLREEGFSGRIVMITQEERLPYDRPNLSKDYLHGHAEPEWMPLRPDEFYTEQRIEVIKGRKVTAVERDVRQVVFESGDPIAYDSILIATGGIPRELSVAGSDLPGIYVLRSFDSADDIIGAATGAKSAVVIGASFIGMEAASSLKQRGLDVTVVAPDKLPFERTLGQEIGGLLQRVHEENGVKFSLGSNVSRLERSDIGLNVILASGEAIAADLVIVGVGVRPATDILNGIELHKDGGVIADEYLQIGDGVFAGGDIVHFPDTRTGESTRIEHWRTALQQGMTAARNMIGKNEPFTGVPFFWTTQFDVTLNYVGHAAGWDEIVVNGSIAEREFLAFYVLNGKVAAVASVGRDHELAVLHGLIRAGRLPSIAELKSADLNTVLERCAGDLRVE